MRLRALPARGLRAAGDAALVDVPARGSASATLPIVRAGAARGSRHAVLLVAESVDGSLARTTVSVAPVEVAPDPSLLPRLRTRAARRRGPPGGSRARLRGVPANPDLTPVPTPTYGGAGMEKPKDYYQLLGVPRDASVTAIKRAFKRLARGIAPSGRSEAPDAFAEIQAAYETLTDAESRRRYDDELVEEDPKPPLEWSFARRPAAGDLRRPFAPDQPRRRDPPQAGGGRRGDRPLDRRPGHRDLRRLRGNRGHGLRLRPLRGRGQGGPPAAGPRARAGGAPRGDRLPGPDRRPRRPLHPADRPSAPRLAHSRRPCPRASPLLAGDASVSSPREPSGRPSQTPALQPGGCPPPGCPPVHNGAHR